MSQYDYTKNNVSIDRLTLEIQASNITIALSHVSVLGAALSITFKTELTTQEATTLEGIVTNHSGLALPENEVKSFKLVEDLTLSKDADGTQISRTKIAKTGSSLRVIPIEVVTGTYEAIVYCKKHTGDNRAWVTSKIYDANDVLITSDQNQANAVKTVIDFEPTFNYEMISARIAQQTIPATNIRLYGVVVPDIPEANGGSVEMVGGLNLKYIDPGAPFVADGKASKPLVYSATYHTNKIRCIILYPAGTQHNFQVIFEYYA